VSKRSSMDERYDRYAEMFDNPVTAESLELGNRVLHWHFIENFQQSTGYEVVTNHARDAQKRTRQGARTPSRRRRRR